MIGNKYLTGTPNRQEYLETAIKWVSGGQIEQHMSAHQHDANASQLWGHFQAVIQWIERTFTTYRKEMKGINWGELYDEYKDVSYDTDKLEKRIKSLMIDDDVTKKKGIYQFVLSGNEKFLSIRQFTPAQRREAYERQNGICPKCNEHFKLDRMDADHIKPWSKGGKTNAENCQMLCVADNRSKGAR